MKSSVWLFAAAMTVSSLALAQSSGVQETSDPAKIAAIEQHAQQLQSGNAATPMMGDHEQMGHHKHGMRHHKHARAHHKAATKEKAPDAPMAKDAKG
jgi:hypothetical protein